MTESDAVYNELSNYVYKGVWEKYNEPPFRRWIWTLEDSKAFLILACLTILVGITQTRAWVLIRYIVFLHKKPVRLPDDANPEPLRRLPQGRAILEALPFITYAISRLQEKILRVFRYGKDVQHPSVHRDYPPVSPWFGFFALLNVTFFVAMGIAIPWLLSEGALEVPVVKSRVTEECVTSVRYMHLSTILSWNQRADGILSQCFGQLNQGCDDRYRFRPPEIHKKRLETCPFPRDICYSGTKPLEITHSNITAYEVGVNSRSRITLNHRLTCVPAYLDSFLLFTRKLPRRAYISSKNSNLEDGKIADFRFGMYLNSMNGPNSVSNESSGLRMAEENRPFDLTVLPRYFGAQDATENPELLHTSLRMDDAESFLVIYRAGANEYSKRVEDPFFAAHNNYTSRTREFFYADHEATALACFEQFQYCLPEAGFCTSWGNGSNEAYTIAKHPAVRQDFESYVEIFMLHRLMPSFFSISTYLTQRIEWHSTVPLTQPLFRVSNSMWIDDLKEQWVTEVENWFMKGIFSAILYVRNGARFHLRDYEAIFTTDVLKELSLCGRILFRDGAYTNINWLGFWIANASLILICFASLVVEWIHINATKLLAYLAHPHAFYWKVIITTKALGSSCFIFVSGWWWRMDLTGRSSRIARSIFVLQPSPPWRTWYGSPRPNSEPSTYSSELDHI